MQLIPPLAQGYYKIHWSSPRRQAAFSRLHLFSKQIAKDILLEAKPQLRIVTRYQNKKTRIICNYDTEHWFYTHNNKKDVIHDEKIKTILQHKKKK